jgi:hypothetical protein
MKKLILTLAVLVGVSFSANTSFAFDGLKIVTLNSIENEVLLKPLAGMKFKLVVANISSKATITIKNENGEVMYTEYASKSEDFSKIFDLSDLADGNYYFEIANGSEKLVKSFKISTEVKRTVSELN